MNFFKKKIPKFTKCDSFRNRNLRLIPLEERELYQETMPHKVPAAGGFTKFYQNLPF
jgi:hypothetical protein